MIIGRRVLGVAAVLMGAAGLAFGHSKAGPLGFVMSFGDVVLVLAGIGINLGRRIAVCAAIALGLYFAVSLALHVPRTVHGWNVWGTWEDVAETLAMGLGAVVAWRLLLEPGEGEPAADRIGAWALRVFGACLVVFGISHFVYLNLTTPLVPAWLPPSRTFWAYATGAAHIAAGLAIASGLLARRAAQLAAAMYGLFGLIVWAPALVRQPTSHETWSETAITCLLAAAAWCVADWLGRQSRQSRIFRGAEAPLDSTTKDTKGPS